MKFSIVVPVYNSEIFLTECLDSIINQSYKNIEIILVDDGSKDKSPVICDEYEKKDKRIKVIHKENGGVVSARKKGASLVTGDYICCVDSDDYIETDYIMNFYDILNKKKVDLVCCNYATLCNKKIKNKEIGLEYGFYDEKKIKEKIYPMLLLSYNGKSFFPTLWGKAIKKDLYLKYQMILSDKISMGDDRAVVIPLMTSATSMYVISSFSYKYRFNESSLTNGHKVFKWDSQEMILKHFQTYLSSNKLFEEQIDRRFTLGFFIVAKSQFNRKEKYSIIKNDILNHLNSQFYSIPIKRSRFGFVKGILISTILKRKNIFLIYLINKII